jgi:methanogenic corrinoid protein MtbC1
MPSRAAAVLPPHPIAVVSERTGLSPDVLRVWERRYGAVQPQRSPGGQRRYTDADVERLRLLHAAIRGGRTIGQVARLPGAELASLVTDDAAARPAHDSEAAIVDEAIRAARALNGVALDGLLRRAAARLGVQHFVERVAVPVMRRVGDDWSEGHLSPAHEHLASSMLEDILSETMRAATRTGGGPRVVIATPAGERHAIGATLVGAQAAAEGWSVVYLGTDLPAADIAAAVATTRARAIALSIVYVDDSRRMLREIETVRQLVPPSVPVLAGGAGALAMSREIENAGVTVAGSMDALRAFRQ